MLILFGKIQLNASLGWNPKNDSNSVLILLLCSSLKIHRSTPKMWHQESGQKPLPLLDIVPRSGSALLQKFCYKHWQPTNYPISVIFFLKQCWNCITHSFHTSYFTWGEASCLVAVLSVCLCVCLSVTISCWRHLLGSWCYFWVNEFIL